MGVERLRVISLPFTCQRIPYQAGVTDDHGNTIPGSGNPVDVACFWWIPESSEPTSDPTGGDRVAADVMLVVASSETVDHRDMFMVDGKRCEVIGLPKDYNHGPFGWSPDRLVIELKWTGPNED